MSTETSPRNMDAPENHLHVHFDSQYPDLTADLSKLEKLVRAICEKFEAHNATVHIGIVDDAGIIEVHRQFLQKDTSTDVISFDLSDEFEPGRTFQIVVNAEMADRQAAKRQHSGEAELALYITHGLLHNLGFDDLSPEDSKKMHETEDELLQQLGFGIIYHKQENID
ncbi:MAG: rRNA maturation RNase YbeY [Planctomycetota bacterium]